MKFLATLVAALLLAQPLPQARAQTASEPQPRRLTTSTPEQFKAEFVNVPCKDADRLDAVKELFVKAGAAEGQVAIDEHKDVRNLVVVKKGATEEKIVVGAHYDKVADGCGAVDNWTGIVALSHLYRTLKDARTQKTLVFAAFGKEERGLVGSRAMVRAIGKEQVAQYCAMVNIDSLGLAAPQVADNMSSKKLLKLAEELAKEMKIPFGHAGIEGASSDSASFIEKKIPALSIHGLTPEWPSILHGRGDQAKRVNPDGVYLGYMLALAMIVRMDNAPCAAYR